MNTPAFFSRRWLAGLGDVAVPSQQATQPICIQSPWKLCQRQWKALLLCAYVYNTMYCNHQCGRGEKHWHVSIFTFRVVRVLKAGSVCSSLFSNLIVSTSFLPHAPLVFSWGHFFKMTFTITFRFLQVLKAGSVFQLNHPKWNLHSSLGIRGPRLFRRLVFVCLSL